MASIQERLQRKREPLDQWSIREKLCLSMAVAKVGDQNWMSVSRSLKPFGEGRPADWFHQKNCAAQYGALLENIDTPKRKKRSSGVEALESPADLILKKLKHERLMEMKKLMDEEKAEYKKLQEELTLLRMGHVTEEQLDQMCKEIDEEEARKEEEALANAQWLKEREIRKEEIERAWRPTIKMPIGLLPTGQKRKASDSIDSMLHGSDTDGESRQTPDPQTKPALSPLLTSLLKSPSHSQGGSSILHSAIASKQRPGNSNANPTITSLLNSSSASLQVSPGIQQLVSTAIAQEPSQQASAQPQKDNISELLDNNDFPNLVDDILQAGDGELPEIKNEEVDVIISNLIENADIVGDPETDLLDGDDIIRKLEEAEKAEAEAEKQKQVQSQQQIPHQQQLVQQQQQHKYQEKVIKPPVKTIEPEIDPFEFQEDPEYDVKLPRSTSNSVQTVATSTPSEAPVESPEVESSMDSEEVTTEPFEEDSSSVSTAVTEVTEDGKKDDEDAVKSGGSTGGSVEVVEVVVMEDENVKDVEDKTQIQDMAHSSLTTGISSATTTKSEIISELKIKEESADNSEEVDNNQEDTLLEEEVETKKEVEDGTEESLPDSKIDVEDEELRVKEEIIDPELVINRENTFTPDYREDIYDENIEVTKIDKSKAKRDYSRKKKDDDFDILLAVEQSVSANIEEDVDSSSEQGDAKKASEKMGNETSHSPWTEEDQEAEQEPEGAEVVEQEQAEQEQEQEQDVRPNTRRYSTPATPIDSVPNSPASSYFEDDRDYRSWKKSLMLVYSRLMNHKYASLFQKPITDEQAPGYHTIVKRPIDLSTIKKNIESGNIRSTAEFKRDILIMFNNAIMYNKTDDTVYKMTLEIQAEAVEQIRILMQAQTDTAVPARRETRTSEGPGTKRKRDSESLHIQAKSKKKKED